MSRFEVFPVPKSLAQFPSQWGSVLKPSPQLPDHLDRLIDQPFDRAASAEVDRWIAYCDAEGVEL